MVVDALASDKENAFPNFLYRITSGVIGFSIIGYDVDGTFLERQSRLSSIWYNQAVLYVFSPFERISPFGSTLIKLNSNFKTK